MPRPKLERFDVCPHGVDAMDDDAVAKIPKEDLGEVWYFWCPGCDANHSYRTKRSKNETRGPNKEPVPVWSFNGNVDRPTFSPSLLVHGWTENGKSRGRCHLFLTDGVINFCGDCDHALAGKSVPLGDGEVRSS